MASPIPNMFRLPVFAGLGSESLFSGLVLDQVAKDVKSPEAQLLLRACHQIFLKEIEASASCGVDSADFSRAEDLLRPSKDYHNNTTTQHAFICLIQLLRYLNLEGSFSSPLLGVSGFCAGLLPAVAVATSKTSLEYLSRAQDCYRVAVKIGIASEQYRREKSTEKTDLPWSLIVDGLGGDAAATLLTKTQNQEEPPSIYVSAYNTEKCVTLSGEGAALRQFVDSQLPKGCRIKPTNIFSLYHNRSALNDLSERLLQEIKDGGASFPRTSDLVGPIFWTTDGSLISNGESSSSDQLLRLILEMVFLDPVDWITVQESILSLSKDAVNAENTTVQVQNFGPGYGALMFRKDLPKGIDVVDVSSTETDTKPDQSWAEQDIAIVGCALDVPGAQMDPNILWEAIMNGINTCAKIPTDRFHIEDYHAKNKSELGNANRSMDSQWGSFLENPFLFDNTFFGISPREARSMDPQQRLLLQTAQRALEDAGYTPNSTKCNDTSTFGCFIGAATGDYAENLKEEMDVYWVPGVLRCFMSGRISYAYGWGGPALTVDTACSSSIVAIWQAARALQTGDANACMAGGVNIITSPDMYIGLDRAHFLSPTGQCKSFDDPADGYCRSDGSAVIVMKRMSDALAENDHILGVIKGVEVNQSGTAHSITHPHTPTQEKLFKSVWQKNHLNPLHVSVVEAHGTGTGAGDPSELHGITNSLCGGRSADNTLTIGSVKANIGHSEAASGCASLIKILMMFKNKTLPPQTLFNKVNSNVKDLAKKGVVINREAKPWVTYKGVPRMAMLNNFGGSGSNGALIVQEFEPRNAVISEQESLTYCFACSTKSESSLLKMRDELIALLETQDNLHIRDICYTSTARRQVYKNRLSTTASSVPELIKNLRKADVVDCASTKATVTAPEAVFLFSGQGSQYLGMGKELMTMFPSFADTVNKCHHLLARWGMPSCLDVINAETGSEAKTGDAAQLQSFQTGVFVLEVAVAQLLISWGIKPKAVAGHSLGEYAALVIAGVMDLPSALKLVAHRASLIVDHCAIGKSCMLAVSLSARKVQDVLRSQKDFDALSISCDNSPDDCVVGGKTESLQGLKDFLSQEKKIKSKMLDVPIAYHTDALAPVLESLTDFAQQFKFSAPSIPVASNLLGRVVAVGEDAFKPEYFASHCEKTVKFSDSMESLISLDDTAVNGCWIEVGPHPIVLPMLSSRLSGKPAQKLPTLKKKTHPATSISQLLSSLFLTTTGLEWRRPFEDLQQKPALVSLPGVPFARKEFYVEYPRDYVTGDQPVVQAVVEPAYTGTPYEFLKSVVEAPSANKYGDAVFDTPIQTLASYISGHTVCGFALCPASVYCELALSAAYALELSGLSFSLSNVTIPKSLVYRDDAASKDLTIVVRVTINTRDQIRGLLEFNISSYDRLKGPEQSQVHCRGLVKCRTIDEAYEKYANLGGLLDQRKSRFVNLDSDSIQTFSSSVLYDKIFTRTVNYTEMYRSIRSIKINTAGKEAYAVCKLPPSRHQGKFVADPILVDALFHAAGFMANLFAANDELYICNKVKSVTVLRDVASADQTFKIHCSNYEINGGKTILSNSRAFDSQGAFAVIKSMKFQRVRVSDRTAAFGVLAERIRNGEVSAEEEELEPSIPSTPFLQKQATLAAQSLTDSSSQGTSGYTSPEQSLPSTQNSSVPSTPQVGKEPVQSKGDISSIENIIAETCGTEKGSVMPQTVLETLGIDSLMVYELRDKLYELSNRRVSITTLTGCTIVEDVAKILAQQDVPAQQVLPKTAPVAPPKRGSDKKEVASPSPTPKAESKPAPGPTKNVSDETSKAVRRLLRLDEKIQNIRPSLFDLDFSLGESLPLPLFLIHPGSGLVIEYHGLKPFHQRPIWAVHNPDFMNPGAWDSIPSMAQAYASVISATSKGPYILGGWSFGGVVAFEAARIMIDLGLLVVGVVLIDSPPPISSIDISLPRETIDAAITQSTPQSATNGTDSTKNSNDVRNTVRELVRENYIASSGLLRALKIDPDLPMPPTTILRAKDTFEIPGRDLPYHPWLDHSSDPTLAPRGWGQIVKSTVTMTEIPGNHFNIFDPSNIATTAEALSNACKELQHLYEREEKESHWVGE